MRLLHAHFHINANITNGGKIMEIRNYLGKETMWLIKLLMGIILEKKNGGVKYEIVLKSANIDMISPSAALNRQSD